MDVERIEWISNLMSHPGSEHVERGEPLDLDSLFGFATRLGDVPQNDRQTDCFAALRIFFIGHQRHDVKIQNTIFRIEDLQVATHRTAASPS